MAEIEMPQPTRRLSDDEHMLMIMGDAEVRTMPSATKMNSHPNFSWTTRENVIFSLVSIHAVYSFLPETLYLAVNVFDLYITHALSILPSTLDLVATAALWIASKFYDGIGCPFVRDILGLLKGRYTAQELREMERHILQTIDWNLVHPTAETFMKLICPTQETPEYATFHAVSRFLLKITTFRKEFIDFPPSAVSRGCLILAAYFYRDIDIKFEACDRSLDVTEALYNFLYFKRSQLPRQLAIDNKRSSILVFKFLALRVKKQQAEEKARRKQKQNAVLSYIRALGYKILKKKYITALGPVPVGPATHADDQQETTDVQQVT